MLKDEDNGPYYYVAHERFIYKRPVQSPSGNAQTMGFQVCTVNEYVDASAVCALLNKADPVLAQGRIKD